MKGYYSIGEISKATGLSANTLRYYDNIGLLKASHIDENTGYRHYDYTAFWRIEVIKIFKMLDVPLDSLMEIVSGTDEQEISGQLKTRKKDIKRLIKKCRHQLESICWFEEMLDESSGKSREWAIRTVHKNASRVIYTDNMRSDKEIHLTLLEASLEEMNHTPTLRRKYGYVLDGSVLDTDRFVRRGEYVNLFKEKYRFTDRKNILLIPEGDYVCQICRIKDGRVDLGGLRSYLEQHALAPGAAFAEEVGLPLFDFSDFYCEIQVLAEPVS